MTRWGSSGFEAEPVAGAAELVTGSAAVWLTLVPAAGVALALLRRAAAPRAGPRVAA